MLGGMIQLSSTLLRAGISLHGKLTSPRPLIDAVTHRVRVMQVVCTRRSTVV